MAESADRSLRWYATREPVVVLVLTATAIVSFLAVSLLGNGVPGADRPRRLINGSGGRPRTRKRDTSINPLANIGPPYFMTATTSVTGWAWRKPMPHSAG